MSVGFCILCPTHDTFFLMKKNNYYPLLLLFLLSFFICTNNTAQNGLNMDGTNDYVQTTFNGVSGNSARTVEAWIRTSANSVPGAGGGIQHVITDWGTFATGQRFTFCVLWGNAIRIEVSGSGISGHIPVNDNLWHHVAGVYDPTATLKFSLFVDGVLDTTNNIPTSVFTGSTVNLRIGQRIDGINPFEGDIDEVRVWNYARTQTEIQRDMNQELCSPSGLLAYYKCNQGTASGTNTGQTNLLDQSGSSNNGTLLNFALSGSSSNWVTGATLTPGTGGRGAVSPTVCGSYTSPSGKFVWTTSNTYQDTITNSAGCDSLITVNLTILNSSTVTLQDTACDVYLSPSGRHTWRTSGTYADTLPNAAGCDSLVSVELVINMPTSATIAPVVCESYISPSGNFTWTTSGTYQDLLTNQHGCDSIVLISLTVLGSQMTTVSETVCDSLISPSGRFIWKTTGTYTDTVINSLGCDSVLIVALTVYQSTIDVLDEMTCDSYTSPSGKYTWNTTGTYYDTLSNANGCFDFITVNLTVVEIDLSVVDVGFGLMANEAGQMYQWLDCWVDLMPIPGAISQRLFPQRIGRFAVEITKNGCRDTSACISLMGVGIAQHTFETTIQLFPNPNSGTFSLDLRKAYPSVTVHVFDLTGKEVFVEQYSNRSKLEIQIEALAQGSYTVSVTSDDRRAVFLMQIR